MLELLAYVVLGIALGVITGLLPGVHPNNLTPCILALVSALSLQPLNAVAVIVAMMIVHTSLAYVPSTFLGAPEEGTALSVLPAHRMLLEGRGYHAVRLTTFGCLGGLTLSAALLAPLILVFGQTYQFLKPVMHWFLIAIVVAMVVLERSKSGVVWAIAIFLLSGLLGVLALDTNLCAGDASLVPLLSGLFGVSVLLESLRSRSTIPTQRIDDEPIETKASLRPLCAAAGAGIVAGIIPAVGPAQGTVLAQLVTRSKGAEDFLVSVSGVNMAKALYSFVALYAIGRPRSGAAVAVGYVMEVGVNELFFIVGVALLAGGIAALLQIKLGELAARHMGRLPYRGMCIAVVITMIALTIYFCGLIGLPILITATAIGLLPAAVGVKRVHGMGVIMLPCILYFSGAKGTILGMLGL